MGAAGSRQQAAENAGNGRRSKESRQHLRPENSRQHTTTGRRMCVELKRWQLGIPEKVQKTRRTRRAINTDDGRRGWSRPPACEWRGEERRGESSRVR